MRRSESGFVTMSADLALRVKRNQTPCLCAPTHLPDYYNVVSSDYCSREPSRWVSESPMMPCLHLSSTFIIVSSFQDFSKVFTFKVPG